MKNKKEEVKFETLGSANTLEMCSFSETASFANNSVENKLSYNRIEKNYNIDLEKDIPNFKFIGNTTLLDIPDISKISAILLIPVLPRILVTAYIFTPQSNLIPRELLDPFHLILHLTIF